MTQLLITGGWLLNCLSTLWILFILLNIISSCIPLRKKSPGFVRIWLLQTSEPLINLLRRTVPTVYRSMDFAPWLTILVIVLMKTFIFRAMVYWGMLNRPLVG